MRSPIRIQFDAVDDTVSIELTAPYFMKEFYEQGGSTQSILIERTYTSRGCCRQNC